MNIFHKTQKKETRRLPMTGKVKKGFRYTVYAARRTAFVYGTRLKTKWQKIGAVLPMIRKSKSVTISMPKALRIFLDFQMLVEYLLGGNTAA